jgi:hypothetical protein
MLYVWRGNGFIEKFTGRKMIIPSREKLCAPSVIPDIPDYRSPVDGRLIGSRSERRDDLKRNNCVEFEPSMSPTKGKFKNPKFAAKRGLQVSEEYR